MRKLVTLGLALALVANPVTANAAGYTMTAEEEEYLSYCYQFTADSSSDCKITEDKYGNENTLYCTFNHSPEIYTLSNAITIDPSKCHQVCSNTSEAKDVSIYFSKKVARIAHVRSKNTEYHFNLGAKRLKGTKLVSRLIIKPKANGASFDKTDKFYCYDTKGKKIGYFTYTQEKIDIDPECTGELIW